MVKKQRALVPGLLIFVVTIGGTILQGRLTNRWGSADESLRAAAQALTATPTECGSWTKVEDKDFPSNVQGILNFAGKINRVYLNQATGQTVSVAVIVGPPGPTSTHVAEMCYDTQGYNILTGPLELAIPHPGRAEDHFRQSFFESRSFEKQRLEICYSWRAGENWEVPRYPRLAFGSSLRLFKIQLAAEIRSEDSTADESVCRQFLQAFLPEFEASVFRKLSD